MEQKITTFITRFGERPVTIFLKNGIKLSGRITGADPLGPELIRDGVTQTIFWDAIATVMPQN